MKTNPYDMLGWIVHNGSGWNHHRTADTLEQLLAADPEALPAVPVGHAVLVAPLSDKPLGLRCALVKILPRITDDAGYDDGCDGEADAWAVENFRIDGVRLASCRCDQQSDDDSGYFIKKMREAIAKILDSQLSTPQPSTPPQ